MNNSTVIRVAALAGLVLSPAVGAKDYRQLNPVQVPVANAVADSPAVDLRVWMDQPDLIYHPGEHASVYLRSSAAGYVTLININGNGVAHVVYPNALHTDNRIGAGETRAIPGAAPAGATSWWAFAVSEPYGANVLKAVITDQPWRVDAKCALDGIYGKLAIAPDALARQLTPISIPVAADAPAQQGFFEVATVIFGVAPAEGDAARAPVVAPGPAASGPTPCRAAPPASVSSAGWPAGGRSGALHDISASW